MLNRTPLYAAHHKLGGKLIEFGGWEMPVHYSSIMDEHLCVRRAAGLFDISHMGEVLVRGAGAAGFLNRTLTNDIRKLPAGQGQYTLLCNERGGVVDDLYAYRLGDQEFLLVINASRIDSDIAWLDQQLDAWVQKQSGEVELTDRSAAFGAVALQGPRVAEFIDQILPDESVGGARVRASGFRKNEVGAFRRGGHEAHVARTGYTGEDGFEIIAPVELIEPLWNEILSVGHPYGLQPCGLGARDTLRTEMGYPLYGHELDETTTPIEAGLGFFVALDKGEFIGRPVLAEQKSKGVSKKCAAFKMTDRSAPPRPQYAIWSAGTGATRIGEVTSGTQSPSLSVGIGMGFVPPEAAKPGTPIEIEIRGRRAPAVVVAKPIYKKPV